MNNQEVIIRKALDLSIAEQSLQGKLNTLTSQRYKAPPAPPAKKQAVRQEYPKFKATTKFNWLALLPPVLVWFLPLGKLYLLAGTLEMVAIIFPIYYYAAIYSDRVKKEKEEYEKSPERLAILRKIEEDYLNQQQIFDSEYDENMKQYNEVILVQYNKELENWTNQHNAEISNTQKSLLAVRTDLSALYNQTKIVPLQYRQVSILQYIYDTISTANYSVKEAIEMYERLAQRNLERQKIAEMQVANEQAMYQNQLLDEQNSIAESARRDANIAAVVSTVQRHNTNKSLKSISNSLKR